MRYPYETCLIALGWGLALMFTQVEIMATLIVTLGVFLVGWAGYSIGCERG